MVVVLFWLIVQPWLVWPQLADTTSQRLTLVCCCVALGLLRFRDAGTHRPLPRAVCWWIAGLLLVMTSHHWHLIREASYFEFFQETALFADGTLVVIALTWGLWALWQLPAAWRRALPWIGVALVAANLFFALLQAQGLTGHLGMLHPVNLTAESLATYHRSPYKPSGLMGLDRGLGAYAVAWLPILWMCWQPIKRWPWFRPLALLSLLCVLLAGKATAWIGVGVVMLSLCPRWTGKILGAAGCLMAAWWWSDGEILKKIFMRLMTWQHTLQAIRETVWFGYGFHPMSETFIRQRFGYALPSLHSDWLALAFHTGVPLTSLAAWWTARRCWMTPRTPMAQALQASFAALAVMSLGQAVVSEPNVASLALVFLVWWWHEQQGVVT